MKGKGTKKPLRLYNILFPIWMLIFFPPLWLVILPGNFLIDSLVLLISLRVLGIPDKKRWYKKRILPIWGFGMLADILGAVYLLLMFLAFRVGMSGDEWYLTVPALILSAVLIFLFNYFITFRKDERRPRLALSLIFAIVTAPYTFLIPLSWIY